MVCVCVCGGGVLTCECDGDFSFTCIHVVFMETVHVQLIESAQTKHAGHTVSRISEAAEAPTDSRRRSF